jgi:uncharacterized membrane protein YfcA
MSYRKTFYKSSTQSIAEHIGNFAQSTIIRAMQLTVMQLASLIVVGLGIGVVGGMLGIGGGVLVIPTLVTLYGFTYPQAVGTSLGMLLPPIGIFAFLAYHRTGNVNLPGAIMLAIGFAVGAYVGSKLVTTGKIPENTLRIIFACFLLYVAGSILFRHEPRVRAVLYTLILLGVVGIVRGVLELIGKHWETRFHIEEVYREQLRAPIAPDYEI